MIEETDIRCPISHDPDDDLSGCGSTNVIGPDDEGLYDCCDCGLFFRPQLELPLVGDNEAEQCPGGSVDRAIAS